MLYQCYFKMTDGTHPKRKTKKYSEEQLQNVLATVRSMIIIFVIFASIGLQFC